MTARIAQQWASYRERVVPVDAGLTQVQECRRAFYAGAEAFYVTVMRGVSTGPWEEVTPDDERLMADLHEELTDFARSVAEGRA